MNWCEELKKRLGWTESPVAYATALYTDLDEWEPSSAACYRQNINHREQAACPLLTKSGFGSTLIQL